jgi:cytochrome c biogenesis protein CcdA
VGKGGLVSLYTLIYCAGLAFLVYLLACSMSEGLRCEM